MKVLASTARYRPQRLKQIIETRGIRALILVAALSADTIDSGYLDFWDDFACAVIGVTHLNNKFNCSSTTNTLPLAAPQKGIRARLQTPNACHAG